MEDMFQMGVVLDLCKLVEYSKGTISSRQLVKSPAGNITLFAFDEGQGLSEHSAPYNALLQLLDGKAEVTVDGRSFKIEAGESIFLQANVSHAIAAKGAFKMMLTMIKA